MPSPLAIRLHLRRDEGPGPVEIFLFEKAEITIGRAASKGRPPTLALADRSVSRRHCAILVSATGLAIEDRGGQAGTFLRGRRLRNRQRIEPGQRFTFSGYTAWIERPRFRPKRQERRPSAAIASPKAAPTGRPTTEPWQPGSGAELWTFKGEPNGLLLRGRALRRGKIWLKGHLNVDTWDLRKRWIKASLAARTLRLRHLRLRGLALLIALLCAIRLGVHSLPTPAAPHPAPSCLNDDLKAIQSWALDDRSNPMRAAIALAWAKSKGCPGGTIEGLLHRALATTQHHQIADLNEAGADITAIAGANAILLTTDTRALHISQHGHKTAIGSGGRWHISGDGRWAAEQVDGERVTLWALTGTPVAVNSFEIRPSDANSIHIRDIDSRARNNKPEITIEPNRDDLIDGAANNYTDKNTRTNTHTIQAIALDRRGHELWIATQSKLLRWRRDGPDYKAQASLANTLSIVASDRIEVGIGGLLVERDGTLWWQSAASGRTRRLTTKVDRWLLVDDGTTLITSKGAVIRRWRIKRRRPVPEVIAELGASVVRLAAIPGGRLLAVATSEKVLLLDTDQRWRRRQALSRTLTYSRRSRAIESLTSDPEGRWLIAADPSGAAIWRLHPGNLAAMPIADLDWGITPPEHLVAVDNALVSITDGRVLRWPLLDNDSGLDGIAVAHGKTTKALAIDPRGHWIASAGDSRARLWQRMTPLSLMPTATLDLDAPATAMAFAKDTWLIARDDAIDVHTLKPQLGIVDSIRLSTGAAIAHLAVAADGAWLLAADTRGRLAAWRVDGLNDSLRPLRSWSQGAAISALAVDPKGTQVLVGDRQGGVRVLRLDSTGSARALADHQGAVLALAVASGGNWLASSGADRRIHISEARDPEHRSQISQVQPAAIRSLTFVGDGTWLAARDNAGSITLHATQSAAILHLGVRPGPPSGLFSDGSRRLYAVGDDGLIELWELRLSGGRPRITGVTELSGASSSGASRWSHDPNASQLLSATPSGVLRLRPLQADGLVNLACQLQPRRVEVDGPVPREFAASLCSHS